MKICVIANPCSSHTRMRSQALAKRGHDVYVVSEESLVGIDGIIEINVKENTVPYLFFLRRFNGYVRTIRQLQPDVIHVHFASEVGGWVAAAMGRRPLIVTIMGSDVNRYLSGEMPWIRRRLMYSVLRFADIITVKSEPMKQSLAQIHNFSGKTKEINWGIDKSLFQPVDAAQLHSRLEFDAKDFVFFHPKAVQPLYNIKMQLEAFRQVHQQHPHTRLIIPTYNADEPYLKDLQQFVVTHDLEHAVRFLPPISSDNMATYYSLSDVVINIPQTDGLPQAWLEAMACGTLVILGDLPAYQDIASHQKNAFITELTPAALTQAMLTLIEDRTLYEEIRQQGLAFIESYESAEELFDELELLYAKLAAERANAIPQLHIWAWMALYSILRMAEKLR